MTDSGSEQRWAAADDLARGVVDRGMSARRRRAMIVVAGVLGLALLISVVSTITVIFAVQSGRLDPSDGSLKPQLWKMILSGVLILAGLAVLGFGTAWAVRTGHFITRWRAVVSPLNRAETKSVHRQIVGKEPVDVNHLPIIVAAARQNQLTTVGLVPLYTGVALGQGANAPNSSSVFVAVMSLLVVVAYIVLGIVLARVYRRAGAFIEKYETEIAPVA